MQVKIDDDIEGDIYEGFNITKKSPRNMTADYVFFFSFSFAHN